MSLYQHGFVRVAAASIPVHLARPQATAREVVAAAQQAHLAGAAVVAFPALTLTGVSTGDLFHQRVLLDEVEQALEAVRAASSELRPLLAVGAPLLVDGRVADSLVWIQRGQILGVSPNQTPPADSVHLFSTEANLDPALPPVLGAAPVGALEFEFTDVPGLRVGAVLGQAQLETTPAGPATVWLYPGWESVRVDSYRRWVDRLRAASELSGSALVSVQPGFGESTNEGAWDGSAVIVEHGQVLAEGTRWQRSSQLTYADIDVEALGQLRARRSPATHSEAWNQEPDLVVETTLGALPDAELARDIPRFPFRVDEPEEVIQIQVAALVRRMTSIGTPKLILGVSGGLDSTLALLVCCEAMDQLGRPRADILAYTMPGFGTSSSTRQNAEVLSRTLGVSFSELDIRPTAQAMLAELGHPVASGTEQYDVTFENVQAGLRTDYLFRLANLHGGLVVGTGDLSELALGWCTYGVGDQMSHYGVNAGIPKTVIQQVLAARATGELAEVLEAILATEISPELIPGQTTESLIGPYELQDFTLSYLLRFGFGPDKISYLAQRAWGEKYSAEQIEHWLGVFFRRFFANQFKREAGPDGPAVMPAGSLSPRAGWRMPSDASSEAWLQLLEGH